MSRGIHPTIPSALFLSCLLLVSVAAPVLAATSPVGKWVGEVKTPDGDDAEIFLTLDQQGGDWAGSLEDPLLGETTVSNLKVTDTRISFTFKPANAPFPLHFSGSYIAGDDRVTGTFSLHGKSRFVKFKRVPGVGVEAVAAGTEPPAPVRVRHEYHIAVTGRVAFWAGLHMVKDETYTINNITTGTSAFDGAAHLFLRDGFNVFLRAYRAGQGITSDGNRLAPFSGIGLTERAYLKLDGYEFGGMGYLGNVMMKNSNLNPYLTAGIGRTTWELSEDGRGSELIVSNLEPFEGSDWSFFFGIGTEYALSKHLALNFEAIWRYFMTKDEDLWQDTETIWNNTHAWGLSTGLTFGF